MANGRNEYELITNRLIEHELNPPRGNFNIQHLKETHRHIFQDMASAGFSGYSAGQLRPEVENGQDWIKNRKLESVNEYSIVAYSAMDKKAILELSSTLDTVDINKLKKLDTEQFAEQLGRIYTKLDAVHPFMEGNSRTLRAFTRQIAKESGFNIEWQRFNKSPEAKDTLAIARDLSVNKLNVSDMSDINAKRAVYTTLDKFEGNKNLPDLMKEITSKRPLSKIAENGNKAKDFLAMDKKQLIEKHPDLAPHMAVIEATTKQTQKLNQQQQQAILNRVRENVAETIAKGEQPTIKVKDIGKDKNLNR